MILQAPAFISWFLQNPACAATLISITPFQKEATKSHYIIASYTQTCFWHFLNVSKPTLRHRMIPVPVKPPAGPLLASFQLRAGVCTYMLWFLLTCLFPELGTEPKPWLKLHSQRFCFLPYFSTEAVQRPWASSRGASWAEEGPHSWGSQSWLHKGWPCATTMS